MHPKVTPFESKQSEIQTETDALPSKANHVKNRLLIVTKGHTRPRQTGRSNKSAEQEEPAGGSERGACVYVSDIPRDKAAREAQMKQGCWLSAHALGAITEKPVSNSRRELQ